MNYLKLKDVLVLACCVLLFSWHCKPVDSFWFTDTNFQAGQVKVLPMIKSVPSEKPNTSLESSLASLRLAQPPEATPSSQAAPAASPTSADSIKCSCSSEWFERQLDLNIRKQFTEYFVKIANEELKKEARAKNLSGDLFGPFKDLIPLFDRLLLLNRLQNAANILGGRGGARVQPLQPPNNEVEEIWINFRPPEADNVQQQLQPAKSNHASLGLKGTMEQAAGIIRVKDREALFDMKSRIQDRFVLVESEQLLVVDTGLGWRPLQMQAALRDFRRGLAKYGLHSNEQRQRLLESSLMSKKPSSAEYLAKARESDASLPNYYHDRSSTINEAEGEDDNDSDNDDDDDLDEDEEEDEEEGDDYSDDYFTGYSLLSSGSRRSKTTSLAIPPTTVTPEQARPHSSSVIGDRPPTVVQSGAGHLPAGSGQPSSRDNHQASGGGSRQLRMAALNEPFTGSIHGIRGADFECSKAARKASIKGSFKAFLASGYQNLNELLRHNVRNLPIVNLRNEELASSWNDLFSKPSKLVNPLSRIYSFDGRLVVADSNWPNKLVWHGAGTASGQRHHLHQCDAWHSNSKTKFGMATPLHTPKALLGPAGSGSKRKLAHRRFSFVGLSNHLNNQTSNSNKQLARFAALDGLDKYPCSMPLIMLCLETVGQMRDSSSGNYLDNYFDMDSRNMS